MSRIVSRDYKCRYGQWICATDEGCPCFDGEHERHISFAEACENSKAICKDAPTPVLSGITFPKVDTFSWMPIGDNEHCEDIYEFCETKINEQVCLKDSCPCGDGACMKYGVCKDGVCSCGNIKTNNHDEFYCSLYYYSEDNTISYYDGDVGGVEFFDDGQSGDRFLSVVCSLFLAPILTSNSASIIDLRSSSSVPFGLRAFRPQKTESGN